MAPPTRTLLPVESLSITRNPIRAGDDRVRRVHHSASPFDGLLNKFPDKDLIQA
jgi:hypothetical protein